MAEISDLTNIQFDGDCHVFEIELTTDLMETILIGTLSRLGVNRGSPIEPKVEIFLSEVYSSARKTIKPKGMYRCAPIRELKEDRIKTAVGSVMSARFANLVKRSEGKRYVCFSVLTIGEDLENKYESEKSIMKQAVVDTIESLLIETAAHQFDLSLQMAVNTLGMQSSSRFSPGYCDWPLNGQKIIFRCLDSSQIGLTLTEHYLMRPSKSISGISVIAERVPYSVQCAFCEKADCPSRRNPVSMNDYRSRTRLF
jgi:hypothetical protein